jgi:hypothetical protein
MNRLHHSSDNPSRLPRKPLSKLAWIAPVVASAVAAGHLLFPSVKAGVHPTAPDGVSSPAAGLDVVAWPGLMPDASFDPIVLGRLGDTDEPDTRGASIAAYDR